MYLTEAQLKEIAQEVAETATVCSYSPRWEINKAAQYALQCNGIPKPKKSLVLLLGNLIQFEIHSLNCSTK